MAGLWNRLKRSRQHRTRDSLSAYLDGEVSREEMARIEGHLEQCNECRAELDSLKQTAQLLHQLPNLTVPRSFLLPATAAESKRTYRARSRVYSGLQGATVLAGLLLALIFVGDLAFLGRSGAPRSIQIAPSPVPQAVVVEAEVEVLTESAVQPVERLPVEEQPVAESAVRPGVPSQAEPAEAVRPEAERMVKQSSEGVESKRAVVAGTAASAPETKPEAAKGDETEPAAETQAKDTAPGDHTATPGPQTEALAEHEPTPVPEGVPDTPRTAQPARRVATVRWAEIVGGLVVVVLLASTLIVRHNLRQS